MGNDTSSQAKKQDQIDLGIFEKDFAKTFKKDDYSHTQPYLIVLVGPSYSGKSSFLKMLMTCTQKSQCCRQECSKLCSECYKHKKYCQENMYCVLCNAINLCKRCEKRTRCSFCIKVDFYQCDNCKQSEQILIASGPQSCTSKFAMYNVKCPDIFGNRNAIVIDTIGFTNTSGELSDMTILSLLHCKLMESALTCQMRVDAVFFFQSCKSLLTIKPLFHDIRLLLQDEVIKNSLIFTTKKNAINDEDELTYEEIVQCIQQSQKEIGTDIPVLNLFTPYFDQRRKKKIGPSDEEMVSQIKAIFQFMKNKPQEGVNLFSEWENVRKQVFNIFRSEALKKVNIRDQEQQGLVRKATELFLQDRINNLLRGEVDLIILRKEEKSYLERMKNEQKN